MKPNNPFLISGYIAPEYFCDRESESATITDALYNGRNITLVAPRRMGKTGLIKHIFHKLQAKQPDVATFYMDIFSTQNLNDFVKLFASTVLGQLDSAPQKTFNKINQFLKSCHPAITFDEFSGIPKITIDIAPAQEKATLKEVFDYLNSTNKRCYIAIDEFQQITEYPESGTEALLRSFLQFSPNVNFIFSGSKQHVMQQMFLSAKKPFYQSTQILFIDSIDINAYYEFANNFFREKNRELPEEIFKSIYHQFDGHTWYIQNLLNRLYGYGENVNQQLVDYAINEIVNESTYAYENLLTAYTMSCIKLLRAIAKEGCVQEVNSGEFIARHRLKAASSVNSALKKLINNELVYKTPQGYIIYDRFMGEWLRRQVF